MSLPPPGPDDVLVRTLFSGVSRGTETLVFRGGVPASQHALMRAPFQEGEFPAPVKYGYLNVGVVEEGPGRLVGRTVFCLYPHQTAYVVPASAVTPVPMRCPRSAPFWPAPSRPRSTRSGTRAAGRRPDRGDRGRHGRLLRRPAARRPARRAGGARRRRSGQGGRRRGAGRGVRSRPTRRATATSSSTPPPPRRPHPRARAARAEGRSSSCPGTATARVRPARGGVPLPTADRARQPGGGGCGPTTRCGGPTPTAWRSRSTCWPTRLLTH